MWMLHRSKVLRIRSAQLSCRKQSPYEIRSRPALWYTWSNSAHQWEAPACKGWVYRFWSSVDLGPLPYPDYWRGNKRDIIRVQERISVCSLAGYHRYASSPDPPVLWYRSWRSLEYCKKRSDAPGAGDYQNSGQFLFMTEYLIRIFKITNFWHNFLTSS